MELVPFRHQDIPIQVTAVQIIVCIGSNRPTMSFAVKKLVDTKYPIDFEDFTDVTASDIAIKTTNALTFTIGLTFDAKLSPSRACQITLLLSEF